MRYLIGLLLLTGCAANKPAPEWNTCVDEKAFVGYRMKHQATGQLGTVSSIYGRSPRCSDPGHPLLAKVTYD